MLSPFRANTKGTIGQVEKIKPTTDQLNAYVDGELSPEEAAFVARAIAEDPPTAELVSKIAALKAILPKTVPTRPQILFESSRIATSRRFHSAFATKKLAAGLLFLISAGIIGFLILANSNAPLSLQTAALNQHLEWSRNEPETATRSSKMDIAAKTGGFRPPDLSAAKLTLVINKTRAIRDGNITHYGYAGTRGCRLSLFVASTAASAMDEISDTSVRQAAWQSDGRSFLLLSSGMDADRFTHLASTIEQYSRGLEVIDQETRQQLAHARGEAIPCRA